MAKTDAEMNSTLTNNKKTVKGFSVLKPNKNYVRSKKRRP
jgi:hypothetical protein